MAELRIAIKQDAKIKPGPRSTVDHKQAVRIDSVKDQPTEDNFASIASVKLVVVRIVTEAVGNPSRVDEQSILVYLSVAAWVTAAIHRMVAIASLLLRIKPSVTEELITTAQLVKRSILVAVYLVRSPKVLQHHHDLP